MQNEMMRQRMMQEAQKKTCDNEAGRGLCDMDGSLGIKTWWFAEQLAKPDEIGSGVNICVCLYDIWGWTRDVSLSSICLAGYRMHGMERNGYGLLYCNYT
ncbi:hypothetical protein EYC84_001808 [Monilinia fructicola]|nr:hypothetical protein EYC84_001808 [Monilinia fructicola]